MPKITPTGTDLLKDKHKGNGLPPPLIMPPPLLPGIDAKPQNENKIEIARPPSPNPEIKVPLKIAIMGTAPSSKMLAPFNDPTWQIWSCSPGNQDIPRWDAWFEIHSNLLWPECIAYGAPYVEWLKKQTKPVYMQDSNLVPNATRLPIEDLIKEFGRYFFTSSFTYMIAMAIRAGATDISLFGIDMASRNEYILQRPGGHTRGLVDVLLSQPALGPQAGEEHAEGLLLLQCLSPLPDGSARGVQIRSLDDS